MIGKTVSHYRILEKLGEGGMGIVYKAEDTKLKRLVALKFLPENLTRDDEAKERFAHEAQAASALDHPNICTIYEIDETEDRQSFIAMAYYEGETLKEKVSSDQLSVNSVIDIAIQIAEGLATAHEAGLTHRDIKPANIMITKRGEAKIVDFGLAKLSGHTRLTKTGLTIGTVAYMSPEQLLGIDADHRSDLWSFGVVLYEMLTGHLPLRGNSEAALIYSIVNEKPEPLQKYRPDLSPEFVYMLNRALEKNPADRYQSVSDMLIDLRRLKRDSEKVVRTKFGEMKIPEAVVVPYQTRVGVTPKKRWTPSQILAGIVICLTLLTVIGYLIFFSNFRTTSSLPPMKTARLTSFQGEEYDPVLSPDGNMIAFSWNGLKRDNFDIYIKLVDAGSALRLTTDAAGDYRPAWSPDGRYIAFVRLSSSSRGLYVIPALGGTERKLIEATPLLESSMCWSADGAAVLTADKDSTASPFNIFAISLETGEKRRLTMPPRDCIGDHTPRVSPSGQMLAFVRMKDFGVEDIYAVPLAGGEPRRITFDKTQITGMSWTADSREIIFTSNQNLRRVSVSSGAPKRLVVGGENADDPSLSLQRHRLAYLQTTNNTNIWRIEIANPALPVPLISSTQENHFPHYSPDGKKIAFASNRSGSLEIWVCDSDGENPVQLTFFGSGVTAAPRWSPDGRRLVFASQATGEATTYIISANGGKPRRLTTSIPEQAFPSWSRDGRWVYFSSKHTGTYQVWKILVEGDKAEQVTKEGGLRAFESSDGKFVYYFKDEGIWQVPVDGGEERPILEPLNAGSVYKWAVAEKGIYFINPQAKSHATIEFFNFATKRVKRVAIIEKLPSWLSLAVSPDERWLLYAQLDHSDSDIMLVENFH